MWPAGCLAAYSVQRLDSCGRSSVRDVKYDHRRSMVQDQLLADFEPDACGTACDEGMAACDLHAAEA